jgi:uncharacterized membrane protein
MATDIQDTVRGLLVNAIEGTGKSPGASRDGRSGGALSGMRGVAAGVGAAALAPMAVKGVGKRLGDKMSEKVDDSGGPAGMLKDMLTDALPFGGGSGSTKGGGLGIGRHRRMPVQQSVDIGAPLEVVYNQWTQFEDWPNFMHRVTRVTQEDDCTVSFAAKIWGKTKEFTAEIETQRPDERIKWRVSQGITHAGVVTFHELGPNLTRVLLGLDVQPGGLLEKAARGMRHVKRAARGDLHRFKAFIEMQEAETGAWRGVIEDGEVVEEQPRAKTAGRQRRSSSNGHGADGDSGSRSKRSQSSSRAHSSSGSSGSGRKSRSRGAGK